MSSNKPTTQQQFIIDNIAKKPLFVRAGAGTGKTTTLISGVVEALKKYRLETGKDDFFDHMLLITFTEKAAHELVSKLRRALLKSEDPELIMFAERVDTAWVSTIHSMCSRLLKEASVEAQLDPSFIHLPAVEEKKFLQRATREVCASLLKDPEFAYIFDFFGYENETNTFGGGGQYLSVSELGLSIADEISNALSPDDIAFAPVTPEQYLLHLAEINKIYQVYAEEAHEAKARTKSASVLEHTEEVENAAQRLEAALHEVESPEEAIAVAVSLPFPRGSSIGTKALRDAVKLALKKGVRALIYEAFMVPAQKPLLELGKKIYEHLRELKVAAGVLSDGDLLSEAYRFLEKDEKQPHPHFAHQFDLVIVDEFQDTNGQQLAVIKKLAKNEESLCFVGDAQQAIYGFRGADISTYLEVDKEFSASGKAICKLDTNFRSNNQILALVEQTLKEELEGFLPLEVGFHNDENAIEQELEKNAITSGARVLVEYTYGENVGSSKEHQRYNAFQIAERIHALLKESKGEISADDVVVLVSTLNEVREYEKALNGVGINTLSVSQKFDGLDEAQAVFALLQSFANTNQTASGVLQLLYGPMFELNPKDIMLISKGNPNLYLSDFFIKPADEIVDIFGDKLESRTYRAFDVLSNLRHNMRDMLVSDLVERACIESGWFARLEKDSRNGKSVVANLYKAIRVIKENVDNQGYGISSAPHIFSAWMEAERDASPFLSEKPKGKDAGAVRISTIHRAKGLEFPVVVVSGSIFDPPDKVAQAPLLIHRFEGKTELSLTSGLSLRQKQYVLPKVLAGATTNQEVSFDSLEDCMKGEAEVREAVLEELDGRTARTPFERRMQLEYLLREEDLAERRRLLYVALTRAKHALIIGLTGKKTGDNPVHRGVLGEPFAQRLGIDSIREEESFLPGKGFRAVLRQVTYTKQKKKERNEEETLEVGPRTFYVFEEDFKPEKPRPWGWASNVLSFSADAQQKTEVDDEVPYEQIQERSYDLRAAEAEETFENMLAKSALRFGSAFHELAEMAARKRQRPREEEIEARARFNVLSKEQTAALSQAFEAWWDTDLRKETYSYQKLLPEYPFFVKDGTRYLRGFIDLLAFDGTRALVVDYKTGEQNLSESEARENHAAQCAWYARALLLAGFSEVTVKFILVQNVNAQGEPLVVDFGTYTKETIPEIEVAKA